MRRAWLVAAILLLATGLFSAWAAERPAWDACAPGAASCDARLAFAAQDTLRAAFVPLAFAALVCLATSVFVPAPASGRMDLSWPILAMLVTATTLSVLSHAYGYVGDRLANPSGDAAAAIAWHEDAARLWLMGELASLATALLVLVIVAHQQVLPRLAAEGADPR